MGEPVARSAWKIRPAARAAFVAFAALQANAVARELRRARGLTEPRLAEQRLASLAHELRRHAGPSEVAVAAEQVEVVACWLRQARRIADISAAAQQAREPARRHWRPDLLAEVGVA